MFRHGVTVSLGDFQSERVEVAYPIEHLRPGESFDDAVRWVDARLRAEIDKIVRREAARGNHIDPPLIGEAGPASLATPPAVAVTFPPLDQPNVQPQVRGAAGEQQ